MKFNLDKPLKVGRVTVDIKGKSYRIRFTYPEGLRHEISIAKVSPEGFITAHRAASLINRDIDLGDFDDTYARYSPKHAKQLELANKPKEYNLLQLWELYKENNKDRIAITTQKNTWKKLDSLLEKVPQKLLALDKSREFVEAALKLYAPGTLKVIFRTNLHPCINQAVKQELIQKNPYKNIPLAKKQKKLIESFEREEIKAIIAAFYSDEFVPKSSVYNHSHYAPYVEFLALSGARPEEAIALTKTDIIVKNNQTYIRIDKAFSCGILLPHTKVHQERLFPCNPQVKDLVYSIRPKESGLLFSTHQDKYIDLGNFRQRYWKVVVDALVDAGEVEKYLKPYCLRHSFITRLVQEGVDLGTIAKLVGNSPLVIMKHYLGADNSFVPPELK